MRGWQGLVRRTGLFGATVVLAAGGAVAQPSVAAAQETLGSSYIDIRTVPDNFDDSAVYKGPSGGTFSVECGRNENKHFNQDNHITSPGVKSAAEHFHDYVGNMKTDAFSTDRSLRAGPTTCRNGDESAYFWPVLRLRGDDGAGSSNAGTILRPEFVLLKFRGNARSKVVAMPRFLRTITGDAKAATNGGGNANSNWTCSNTRNKRTDRYPLCTGGAQVLRILDFPSCWDGRNLDSSSHRDHIVFPNRDGSCPQGRVAVPQLHMVVGYQIEAKPNFAVDSFPDQRRNPSTDHGDFHNIMLPEVMDRVVGCLNAGPGRNCQE